MFRSIDHAPLGDDWVGDIDSFSRSWSSRKLKTRLKEKLLAWELEELKKNWVLVLSARRNTNKRRRS